MSLARTYAKALYEFAGADSPKLVDGLDQLSLLLLENDELARFYRDPSIPLNSKEEAMSKIASKMQAPEALKKFLSLLIQKKRIYLLPQIAESFKEVEASHRGTVLGVIESAEPLADETKDLLGASFKKRLATKVEFMWKKSPRLLAGLRVTVAGVSYDGSLRGQLDRLKEKFVGSSKAANGNF